VILRRRPETYRREGRHFDCHLSQREELGQLPRETELLGTREIFHDELPGDSCATLLVEGRDCFAAPINVLIPNLIGVPRG
jgi:hypothetical protein